MLNLDNIMLYILFANVMAMLYILNGLIFHFLDKIVSSGIAVVVRSGALQGVG